MGGEGLVLVRIDRKRVYAKSSKWSPSYASTTYFIGKNEAGTYFAHPVPNTVKTVREAVSWIWNGKENQILARQGDIALIEGAGPKMPELPDGHKVIEGEEWIVHESHPRIPMPGREWLKSRGL